MQEEQTPAWSIVGLDVVEFTGPPGAGQSSELHEFRRLIQRSDSPSSRIYPRAGEVARFTVEKQRVPPSVPPGTGSSSSEPGDCADRVQAVSRLRGAVFGPESLHAAGRLPGLVDKPKKRGG